MSDCERIREDLAPFATGSLDPSRAKQVATHVASCPECAAELESVSYVRRMIAAAPLEHDPPPDLADKVFALPELEPLGRFVADAPLEHEPPVDLEARSLVRSGIASEIRTATGWQRVAAVVAPAFGVAAVALAAIGVYWHSQENELAGRIRTIHDAAGPLGVKLTSLHFTGAEDSGAADGDLWHMPHDNYRLVIHAHGLPLTPPGFHYEVWMSGSNGRQMMAGSFRVLTNRQTVFPLFVGIDPAEYPHVEIRLEREDGDPALTGSTVMHADLVP
ncbi:MAG: zf-HC2 domain-containing protein [Actinomycetota bacterium]